MLQVSELWFLILLQIIQLGTFYHLSLETVFVFFVFSSVCRLEPALPLYVVSTICFCLSTYMLILFVFLFILKVISSILRKYLLHFICLFCAWEMKQACIGSQRTASGSQFFILLTSDSGYLAWWQHLHWSHGFSNPPFLFLTNRAQALQMNESYITPSNSQSLFHNIQCQQIEKCIA